MDWEGFVMKRRSALLTFAAASTGLFFAATAQAQNVELKVSMFAPPSLSFNKEFVIVAQELEQKTQGRLKLALFHSSQLGPAPRQYDLVRTGVADIAYHLTGFTPGRFP